VEPPGVGFGRKRNGGFRMREEPKRTFIVDRRRRRFRHDAEMRLTGLAKSSQFGTSIGFALQRRFAGGPLQVSDRYDPQPCLRVQCSKRIRRQPNRSSDLRRRSTSCERRSGAAAGSSSQDARAPSPAQRCLFARRLIDIVKGGFDAGVRHAEAVPQDMSRCRLVHTRGMWWSGRQAISRTGPSHLASRPDGS
jgi:hypothetical protein